MNQIIIETDFITLGQFLKKAKIIDTGGQAKYFLEFNDVKINNNIPQGRSSKIYPGDAIWINNIVYQVIKK
ncbi:RNA-binding S4 domain-containing protein [Mycoplasma sp. 744]|uniref:RNA-binding S4 domain-containing protein n=1 Tax=unclassified Mycoplasma TaxID=2683645 RepID=UPI00211B8EF3|nr:MULTISPECIES: RNA-binding S4 domain-containing protein [unclassified Mycoplasma]MEA4115252.1 RNA-binding S4 domain-containing protein [Mycoplasma sp. 744]UUM19257.1 RNA-binding S4 domain-containing protein [Mycoplasma sp. 1018B]